MNYQEMYNKKKTDVFGALEKVKSGDLIWTSYNGLEPKVFMSNLHTIAHRVEGVLVRHAGVFEGYPFVSDPTYRGRIVPRTGFTDYFTRKAHEHKGTEFMPAHLHNGFRRGGTDDGIDVFVVMVGPMDKHGYFRMSLSVIAEREALEATRLLILEVNPNLPNVLGDNEIHISEVDYLYESNEPIITIPDQEPDEVDMAIGKNVAALVEDGSTIQLGIGKIPDAVAKFFMEKNDLGVHTEMITSSVARLAKAGVITGRKKTLYPKKIIGNFALGSQELYEFLDDNPSVMLLPGRYTNDPKVIMQNYKMVSINAALQVDLVGQICSESIGSMQYSGTGGAVDFAYGAIHSEGGKSIIAIKSTTKNGTISAIQPVLSPGSIVTISRNDIDYVVTEFGVATMKGTPTIRRVENLINVAHPDFRDELREGAARYKLW